MSRIFLGEVSQQNARISMFFFFCLLTLSMAFFVFADDATTNKNIFQDSDQDGLSNDEEALYKTDPMNKDSDGDGYTDSVEIESGYDPLKPAPGDRVVVEESKSEATPTTLDTGENLTDVFAEEISSIVENTISEGEDVSLETLDEKIQAILGNADSDIILPDVDMSEIKIKKIDKDLKGEKRKEKEKEIVLEYLTVMSYVLANNSPKSIQGQDDLTPLFNSLLSESISAVVSGNTKYTEDLSGKGEKVLEEIKNIEVPEPMLDVHVKAIKMAKYMVSLKSEVNSGNDNKDPLRQIAALSKLQGLLSVISDFSQEIYGKLGEYDIEGIPIDL